MKKIFITLCSTVLALASPHLNATPLGTAFTYQGRLTDGANPANGTVPMVFGLWDADMAGINVGSPSSISSNVTVANGLFTVDLDFGATAFSGDARWLEIRVNGTLMTTRQRVAPTPNALYASMAGTAKGIAANGVSGISLQTGLLHFNGATYLHENTLYFGGDASHGVGWRSTYAGAGIDGPVLFGYSGGGLGSTVPDVIALSWNRQGNVGIGTTSPIGKLEVVAQDALRLVGFQPFLTFFDDNAGYARGRIQSVGGDLNLFTESYINGANPSAFLRLHNNGNVGLGNFDPSPNTSKLQIYAQDGLRIVGYQPFLNLIDANAGYAYGRIQSVNGEITLETEGFVNGSRPNAYAHLNGQGNFAVCTLTIRGGCDIAEPFPTKEEEIEKGSVVVIDEEHSGRLKLSTRAYDTQVAGIVSGANGINPGIALHQEGVIEGGRNVALSGRVYVQADASSSPIKPGDLLTTSNTPGHAMKVTDHAKAQGAIIGKAMSALKEGKGMVMVLVTLQ